MNARLERLGSLIGRLAVATIFVHSGWGKLGDLGGVAAHVAAKGLPAPELAALAAGLLEFVGGLALALGLGSRLAAFALALFLVPTTWLFHNPVGLETAAAGMQWIHVYKNLAIAGGLLAFASFGPGSLSVGAWLRRHKEAAPVGARPVAETAGSRSKQIGLAP
ncbi:MAG: DoxX family protein [Holophagales bacterium]|nr:DoxX family protein [Holophagales bacterium]